VRTGVIAPDLSFFLWNILLLTLSCWDHISCFYVVSLSANDLPLVRSLPFLSVGFVACLGT